MENLEMTKLLQKEKNFWSNKTVLITGHTGFKGSWLSLWLKMMGAKVFGVSNGIPTSPSLFEDCQIGTDVESHNIDINNYVELHKFISDRNPQIVVHLAAQALVKIGFREPLDTYKTNIVGSVNLLEACRHVKSVKAILIVTSDKCYANDNSRNPFDESSVLGGNDPYSSSKACVEIITNTYRSSYFKDTDIKIATARSGNVIGGGDWASDRLIPDIFRCIGNGQKLQLRYPTAIRPWQYVLEPLWGYIKLCKKLYLNARGAEGAWNFGPDEKSHREVSWIVNYVTKKSNFLKSFSYSPAEDGKEHLSIFLDSKKSQCHLNWKNLLTVENSLDLVLNWYGDYLQNKNMREVTIKQINSYEKILAQC